MAAAMAGSAFSLMKPLSGWNSPLCGFHVEFSSVALNGCDGRIRLYTEIALPSGKSYALERTGSSAAELLFLYGLDAVNAEAVRAGKSNRTSGSQ